ncbi:hypothetical protein T265_01169 [Opisthorchis viverrini]|uniref:Uncharacterized protein n=1 Tax=Opisthorchis viverrini TaxID=6198 RepID=A0A074ZZJ1_OPIVI|nr:hypothetical protein T265_01169 [Opisthorchis viverrini]KER32883.1 hypothetical protein T265_01169 [Opisthorchis viverrini]
MDGKLQCTCCRLKLQVGQELSRAGSTLEMVQPTEEVSIDWKFLQRPNNIVMEREKTKDTPEGIR